MNLRQEVLHLATNNAHKAVEIARSLALAGSALRVESAGTLGGMPEVEETGATLRENAALKARALHAKAPDTWVLADDTGLFVDALGGAPGVHTARYAGPLGLAADNIKKLLAALSGIPPERRGAQFVCLLHLLGPGGEERTFEGIFRGRIAEQPAGCGGFGYDPVFIPEGQTLTVAELPEELKNRISHRAKAVKALAEALA